MTPNQSKAYHRLAVQMFKAVKLVHGDDCAWEDLSLKAKLYYQQQAKAFLGLV